MAVKCAGSFSAWDGPLGMLDLPDDAARLNWLISEELDHVLETKRRLDLKHPTHTRELSRERLRHVARAIVFHRLCTPNGQMAPDGDAIEPVIRWR